MNSTCVADNDCASMKQPRTVSPSSNVTNSNTDDIFASGPTRKSALKATKEGHDGRARSAISASFDDSENEVIEIRARGHHRKMANGAKSSIAKGQRF